MTTYTCKCGKTFTKNTEAGTTGFRMPDYGPEHECFGCPFVCNITTWDPTAQTNAIQNHECRGSKSIRYDTTISLNSTDKTVATIYTLDFEFLRLVHEFAETLEGFEPDQHFFDNRSAAYDPDGRFRYTLYPMQNHNGISAKIALNLHFFNSDGVRRDAAPEQEKEIIISQIKEAKSMNIQTQSFVGTMYRHGGRVLHVGPYQEKFRTFFYFLEDPSDEIFLGAIPSCDTPEIAQKMLDDYASKHSYEPYTQPTSEAETPLESDLSSDDTPADAAGEPESADAGQQGQDETPDSENDPPAEGENPGDSENDTPDPDNNFDSSDNDMQETQDEPCDWKNASGADEDDEQPEFPESSIPVGEPFSLMDDSLTNLINIFDGSINEALRVAVKAKQGFTFQTKITFDYRGGAFAIKHDEQYQFDPIKVKTKGELSEEIQIVLDEDGIPIIPYDRQHQLNFSELQPGREIPPTPIKTTVDGNTGLVESVEPERPEDVSEDIPNGDEINEVNGADLQEEREQVLPPCDHEDCPFHGAAVNGCTGCCFDSEDPDGVNYAGDVWTAINMESCERPEVLEAYRKNNPEEDYDGSNDFPDDSDDLPFDMQDNYEEDSAS